MTFKATLHILTGIAVLFIAIIPARMVSVIFSQDTTIFVVSLIGFGGLLEYGRVLWEDDAYHPGWDDSDEQDGNAG